jgi:hypothetical protein
LHSLLSYTPKGGLRPPFLQSVFNKAKNRLEASNPPVRVFPKEGARICLRYQDRQAVHHKKFSRGFHSPFFHKVFSYIKNFIEVS